jgi:hypothetical protein
MVLLVKKSKLEAAAFRILCWCIEGAIRAVFEAADEG